MRCSLPLFIALLTTPAAAQWSQYLGPNSDSTSPETGLLDEWPADGPKELWRIEVGPGYGGAAVDNAEVIIHDRVHGEADILRVLDLKKSGVSNTKRSAGSATRARAAHLR